MPHTVYLALGSNLGDRLANLQRALALLAPDVRPEACSPVYETPPWGYTDQPPFLNQAAKAATELPPAELLAHLKAVESRMGRVKTIVNGPRIIDLDILFYDDLALETPALSIPHPRMRGRAFVLKPLADLAPGLRHPELGMTVGEMLAEVDAGGITLYHPGSCPTAQPIYTKEFLMTDAEMKPLNWTADAEIGYTVVRRPDGGMQYTFTDLTPKTLAHWREFALEHLLGSDRLTRNLYDLRQVPAIPEMAVQYAVEVNSDPSARNIRLAVVVANEKVRQAAREIDALTSPAGVEMEIFTDLAEAEAWLDRPLTLLV